PETRSRPFPAPKQSPSAPSSLWEHERAAVFRIGRIDRANAEIFPLHQLKNVRISLRACGGFRLGRKPPH
ncbi:hypothetical protein, partial [Ralstonia solanacearum]|uniref:hypothetical protein n=1 Tax=Ralstonia solanacearum TaxID=305 RepID=UPI001E3F00D5